MKPSEKKHMEVKFTKFIPFGSYFAMMWKGDILVKKKDKEKWEKQKNTERGKVYVNHEKIHLKQAVSTNNSWFRYYWLYGEKYLKNLPLINGFDFPYRCNPFELEAYENEHNLNYLDGKESTDRWKLFDKLTLKDKKKLWKEYKAYRKEKLISFNYFLNNIYKVEISETP